MTDPVSKVCQAHAVQVLADCPVKSLPQRQYAAGGGPGAGGGVSRPPPPFPQTPLSGFALTRILMMASGYFSKISRRP